MAVSLIWSDPDIDAVGVDPTARCRPGEEIRVSLHSLDDSHRLLFQLSTRGKGYIYTKKFIDDFCQNNGVHSSTNSCYSSLLSSEMVLNR